jgi:hypothetical protein
MEPTDTHPLTSLTDEQIERLAAALLDEFGSGLDRARFNDAALLLLENVPGFELMTQSQLCSYLRAMWVCYRTFITSNSSH